MLENTSEVQTKIYALVELEAFASGPASYLLVLHVII